MKIENTADLRKMLIETIEGVKSGTLDPRQAQAIASLSTKILHSAKLDLEMMRFSMTNREALGAGEQVLRLIAGNTDDADKKQGRKAKSA